MKALNSHQKCVLGIAIGIIDCITKRNLVTMVIHDYIVYLTTGKSKQLLIKSIEPIYSSRASHGKQPKKGMLTKQEMELCHELC